MWGQQGRGLRAGGCGYLARLGGGRQARVSPVVAPYGHHAGADFVAQFQGEHGQQHDGGGSGEDGWQPEAGAAEPATPAAVRAQRPDQSRFCCLGPGVKERGTRVNLAGRQRLLRLRRPAQGRLRLRRLRPVPAAARWSLTLSRA